MNVMHSFSLLFIPAVNFGDWLISKVLYQAEMSNTIWIQLLRYNSLLLFFVMYDGT